MHFKSFRLLREQERGADFRASVTSVQKGAPMSPLYLVYIRGRRFLRH